MSNQSAVLPQDGQQFLSYKLLGVFNLGLRLVVGWTYFSAFWRRLILSNKLDPDAANYIGIKFNHFLPQALGIGPIIEFLLEHPAYLWWAMLFFTLIEGVVGLFFMLGFLSRLMSLAVLGLALGILLGSGWLGTTCLDEWQIGILGVSAGASILMTGGGRYSLDHYALERWGWTGYLSFWSSGPIRWEGFQKPVLWGSLLIFALALYTNQYFHSGLWGQLHNKSVKPKLALSAPIFQADSLSFELYRIEGADVYGSFLIQIELLDEEGQILKNWDQKALSSLPDQQIQNAYPAKIKAGAHSLVVPLGAKARLSLPISKALAAKAKTLKLVDISGLSWELSL
ncbi:TQO small subunit DoxD [Saprospira grandis]|uniref:Terminal quinol oxidase subunit n=1 Tax=Saprospira grandis (strain Lewin) TaxID=984262 RepID=H6L4M5_SAPGL|nr:TQO small subunit DoxD [Saprospira grandis]AFC23949.1 terminal quinol oxidase subunit [Saprospira grandis str. Lewin]